MPRKSSTFERLSRSSRKWPNLWRRISMNWRRQLERSRLLLLYILLYVDYVFPQKKPFIFLNCTNKTYWRNNNHAVCFPTSKSPPLWRWSVFFHSFFPSYPCQPSSMFQSFIKSVGLAPLDAYVEPRISIGNAVADREYSTGHFRMHLDAEKLALFIRNGKGRVIWKCKVVAWYLYTIVYTYVTHHG